MADAAANDSNTTGECVASQNLDATLGRSLLNDDMSSSEVDDDV
jgi:hypothetical protein